MNTLFFSTKDFEQPYLVAASAGNAKIKFVKEALGLQTASLTAGYTAISIFTGDDASAEVLVQLHALGVKFIAIRAAGHDNVDLQKADQLNIVVANVPDYSPYAVAEHAMALILALNRKLILSNQQVQQQNFTTGNLIGFDLNGKTAGIIGTGKTGAVLVKILHGFGCTILGCDVQQDHTLAEKYNLVYTDLSTLCSSADIISLHIPLTAHTKYLINKEMVERMRPGTMLINTSRGACVDTTAIIHGLENGQIGYYGADVYEKERGLFFYNHSGKPLQDEVLSRLCALPNVLITPHQAFATREALTNIATTTFYNITCWEKQFTSKYELISQASTA